MRSVRLVGPDFGGHIELDLGEGKLELGASLFVADREWVCEVIRRWFEWDETRPVRCVTQSSAARVPAPSPSLARSSAAEGIGP